MHTHPILHPQLPASLKVTTAFKALQLPWELCKPPKWQLLKRISLLLRPRSGSLPGHKFSLAKPNEVRHFCALGSRTTQQGSSAGSWLNDDTGRKKSVAEPLLINALFSEVESRAIIKFSLCCSTWSIECSRLDDFQLIHFLSVTFFFSYFLFFSW